MPTVAIVRSCMRCIFRLLERERKRERERERAKERKRERERERERESPPCREREVSLLTAQRDWPAGPHRRPLSDVTVRERRPMRPRVLPVTGTGLTGTRSTQQP